MELISQGILENIKNEHLGLDNLEKDQILRPFSGLAPSKLKMCFNFFLIIAYVYIAYRILPANFQEN